MSYAASTPLLSDIRDFPLFYRTVPAYTEYNRALYGLMRELQWWNIAVIHGEMPHFTLSVESLSKYLDWENQRGNNPKASIVSATGLDGFLDRHTPPDLTTRIIVALVPEDEASLLLCGAFRLNMTEENYQFIFLGGENSPSMLWKNGVDFKTFHLSLHCSIEDLAVASEATLFITHNQLVSSLEVQSTFTEEQRQFWERFKQKLNGDMSIELQGQFASRVMATYDAVWAISLALEKVMEKSDTRASNLKPTNTTYTRRTRLVNRDELRGRETSEAVLALNVAMEETDFDGLFSRIKFNSTSHSLSNPTSCILQLQAGVVVPIGQHIAASDKIDLSFYGNELKWRGSVFPQDRPTIVLQVASIYIVCIALGISFLGIVLSVIMLSINWIYRKHKVIKASSPYMNFVIITGCMFGFLSVPLLSVENLDVNYKVPLASYYVLCNIRPFLLSIGFTLSFGALFAKTFRIYLVFRDPWTRKRAAKDRKLFAIIGVLLAYDIVVMVLWVSVNPLALVRSLLNYNPEEFTEDIYCYCAPSSSASSGATSVNFLAWIALVTLPKAILLAFGIFLVIQTGKIKAEFFRDAKYTGIAIFGVMIASGFGVPTALLTMLFFQTNITYIVASVTILSCSYLILLMVFVPKFQLLRKYRKKVPARVLIGLNPSFRITRNLARGNPESYLELYGRAIRDQHKTKCNRRHPLVQTSRVHANRSVMLRRAYATMSIPKTEPQPTCVCEDTGRNQPPTKKPDIQVESMEDWWEPAFEDTLETASAGIHETAVSFEGYQGIVSVLSKGKSECVNQTEVASESLSSVGSFLSTITEIEHLDVDIDSNGDAVARIPYFHFSSFSGNDGEGSSASTDSLSRSKSFSFSQNRQLK